MSQDNFPAIIKRLTQLTPEQEAERATWQYRAVLRTRANQTMIGCVLLAVLQRSAFHRPPRFGHHAIIAANGIVCTMYQHAAGQEPDMAAVEHIEVITDGFRRLADDLKLMDSERAEMMGELRKWISRDLRAAAPKLKGD